MNKSTKTKNTSPSKRKRKEEESDSEDSPTTKKPKIDKSPKTSKSKKIKDKLKSLEEKSKNLKEMSKKLNMEKKEDKKIKIEIYEDRSIVNYWKDYELLAERQELDLSIAKNIVDMLNDGSTIPFIARYRKHFTGNMLPEKLREVKQCYEQINAVKVKSRSILKSLEADNYLHSHLKKSILSAKTLEELEHIYAPYKVAGKKTLYERAKKVGLEQPANKLLTTPVEVDLKSYVDTKYKDLDKYEKVEQGFIHIIAHVVATNVDLISYIRELRRNHNFVIASKRKKLTQKTEEMKRHESDERFEHYYDFKSSSRFIKPHQILAINRGEQNKILFIKTLVPDYISKKFYKYCWEIFGHNIRSSTVKTTIFQKALDDCYKRLIQPFIIREVRSNLKTIASKASLDVFCDNVKQVLLMTSVKGSVIAGIDPGFKHGCKIAIIGTDGSLLDSCILFPFRGYKEDDTDKDFKKLLKKHRCSLIALGNGTACRETETWLSNLIERNFFHPLYIEYTIVNENGTSIYSCSEEAKKEFPLIDPNIISAISIARRVQDPLAEYVKVNPRHIGVGMYQHDLPKKVLEDALDEVVSECVSFVGVDINTCSDCLLKRVAGLSEKKAHLIMEYRKKNGPFISRQQLLEIKGIGPKCFEQCAGFLKVGPLSEDDRKSFYRNPKTNQLDMTIIHPESYKIAMKLLNEYSLKLSDIGTESFIEEIDEIKTDFDFFDFAKVFQTSEHTLRLIFDGLSRRLDYDMRNETDKRPFFKKGLTSISDLTTGTVLTGRVVNNTHFGSFVDIGVGSKGLIHSSQLNGVKLGIGDIVEAKVIHVKVSSRKISLAFISKLE